MRAPASRPRYLCSRPFVSSEQWGRIRINQATQRDHAARERTTRRRERTARAERPADDSACQQTPSLARAPLPSSRAAPLCWSDQRRRDPSRRDGLERMTEFRRALLEAVFLGTANASLPGFHLGIGPRTISTCSRRQPTSSPHAHVPQAGLPYSPRNTGARFESIALTASARSADCRNAAFHTAV